MNAPIPFHLEDELPETLSELADEILESADGQLDVATERLIALAEETENLAHTLISRAARDVLRYRLKAFRYRLRATNGQAVFAPVTPAPAPVPQRGVPSLPPVSPLRLSTMKELAMTNWMKYPLPLKGQPPLGSAYRAQLEQSIDVNQRNIRTQQVDVRWYRLIIERIGARRVEDALTEETLAELHAQAT